MTRRKSCTRATPTTYKACSQPALGPGIDMSVTPDLASRRYADICHQNFQRWGVWDPLRGPKVRHDIPRIVPTTTQSYRRSARTATSTSTPAPWTLTATSTTQSFKILSTNATGSGSPTTHPCTATSRTSRCSTRYGHERRSLRPLLMRAYDVASHSLGLTPPDSSPEGVDSATTKGQWWFQKGRSCAILLLHEPREYVLPGPVLEELFKIPMLKHKHLVTKVVHCSAYARYLSSTGTSLALSSVVHSPRRHRWRAHQTLTSRL